MPVAEIINEIDSYLARLRQARELLLDRTTVAPKKKAPPRKGKAIVRQAAPAPSSRRRADENKPRSNHAVAHLNKVTKRMDMSAQGTSAVASKASGSEKPAMIEPERTIQHDVLITRLPAKGPQTSIRSMRDRTAKPAQSAKRDKVNPPIALAGSLSSKVVVVSAEQVQREREQAAHPIIRQPRAPSSGLSGRLAFEALFKD